jgi:CheY-like chemotaxis protein
VLLVDDDFETRELLQSILVERGADADVASGGREALAKLVSRRYDVIVSDIAMPDVDGYRLLAEVRRLPVDAGAGIPAIALTAYAGPQSARQALSAGFQGHLAKPVDPDTLVATIADLLRTAPAA